METIQGKVPLETYRKFRDYMERNSIESRSEALRQLLAKALFDDALGEHLRFEHRETRKEMERLIGLVLANLGRPKPLSEASIQGAIEKIAEKTNTME